MLQDKVMDEAILVVQARCADLISRLHEARAILESFVLISEHHARQDQVLPFADPLTRAADFLHR